MGTIFQIIFDFLFLYLGNRYFSEFVRVDSMKTLLTAMIGLIISAVAVGILLIILAIVFSLIFNPKIVIILLLLAALVANPMCLYFTQCFVSGLTINGIAPYVVYGLIQSIVSLAFYKGKKEEN